MTDEQNETVAVRHANSPTGLHYEVATSRGRFYLPYRARRWDLEQRIADEQPIRVCYVPDDQFASWLKSDQTDTYRGEEG